jgi:hypothetical protein
LIVPFLFFLFFLFSKKNFPSASSHHQVLLI